MSSALLSEPRIARALQGPEALGVERRAAPMDVGASGRRLTGYAALFGDTAALPGGVRERIAAGAFTSSLSAGADILALVDHDPAKVLARTRSGSLRLREDARGLAFEIDLPETTAANDILALAQRGDLGGMSFGFSVPAGGDQWRGQERTLLNVALREISVVSAWPAYPGTEVNLRAAQGAVTRLARLRRLKLAELGIWA